MKKPVKDNKLIWKPLLKWPSGDDKNILLLDCQLEAIATKYELPVIRHKDNLDWYHLTYFYLHDNLVVLTEYDNSPTKGIQVRIDREQDTDSMCAAVLIALELSEKDVLWKQSEI